MEDVGVIKIYLFICMLHEFAFMCPLPLKTNRHRLSKASLKSSEIMPPFTLLHFHIAPKGLYSKTIQYDENRITILIFKGPKSIIDFDEQYHEIQEVPMHQFKQLKMLKKKLNWAGQTRKQDLQKMFKFVSFPFLQLECAYQLGPLGFAPSFHGHSF